MTDRNNPGRFVLEAHISDVANRFDPGIPPIADLVQSGRRTKRRRTAALLSGSVATIAVVAISAGWLVGAGAPSGSSQDQLVADSRRDSDSAIEENSPAPGFRWVGQRSVAVQVPSSWHYGSPGCGMTPGGQWSVGTLDTNYCHYQFPAHTTHVSVRDDTLRRPIGGTEVVIPTPNSGQTVGERHLTTCSPGQRTGDVEVCTGSVVLDSEGVIVSVRSTEGASAVDDVLDTVRVIDRVGVPDPTDTPFEGTTAVSQGLYREALERLQLRVEFKEYSADEDAAPLTTQPLPGSMVEPGDKVTVYVWAQR